MGNSAEEQLSKCRLVLCSPALTVIRLASPPLPAHPVPHRPRTFLCHHTHSWSAAGLCPVLGQWQRVGKSN